MVMTPRRVADRPRVQQLEPQAEASPRPEVRGKFIFIGEEKLYVRGATYGAFRRNEDGVEFHDVSVIERDFAQMAANGFNAVRIPHTMPPRALLDVAHRNGLKVMVGLSAEQYIGYLADNKPGPNTEEVIRKKVADCAGHPALLCYALGNEIPAPTARWLGRRKVEHYLECLYRAVKDEDPGGLVTYVNYPSTEYLDLGFLDLLCFNVYLEDRENLDAYLHRLQNLAGDTRPLLMSEIGLDSLRNGEDGQAESLGWQLETSFAAGCAGAFVFSWTDEWFRGDDEVQDWAFGLTRKDRRPKPALPVGPVHALLSDREAEHIPGCNMAFLRSALEKIGGFDDRYRAAVIAGARATFPSSAAGRTRLGLRALTAFLHLVQPLARLKGRRGHELTPWRRRNSRGFVLPRRRGGTVWSEEGHEAADRLQSIMAAIEADRPVIVGGEDDRWGLEARGGALGSCRLLLAVEDHGGGAQYVRFRLWPRSSRWVIGAMVPFVGLASQRAEARA